MPNARARRPFLARDAQMLVEPQMIFTKLFSMMIDARRHAEGPPPPPPRSRRHDTMADIGDGRRTRHFHQAALYSKAQYQPRRLPIMLSLSSISAAFHATFSLQFTFDIDLSDAFGI